MIHILRQLAFGLFFILVFFSCQKEVGDLANGPGEMEARPKNDPNPGAESGTKTAQSIQVNMKGIRKSYQLVSTDPWLYRAWEYNWSERPPALSVYDAYFTLTTSGYPTEAQIERGKHLAMQDNKCNFWFGQPLQTITFICGLDNNRRVISTPKSMVGYTEKTGWTLQEIQGEGLTITLTNIFIASASFMEKRKISQGWSKKYSFAMRNEDLTSRLSDLKVELLHNGEVIETRFPEHILQDSVNWHYEVNSGPFGDAGAYYAFESGVGSDRSVGSILMGELDNFTKNDNEGGSRALVPNQTFSGLVLTGKYAVRISGVLKGNSFYADKKFSIVTDLVDEGECHGGEDHH